MSPFGGVRGNVHGSSIARWKARGRLHISANWTFFASSHVWGAMSKYWLKLSCLKGGGSLWAQISGKGVIHQRQKVRVPGLSRGVVCVNIRLAVLLQYRRVTHTDTQTDTRLWLLPAHCLRRAGKKVVRLWPCVSAANRLQCERQEDGRT